MGTSYIKAPKSTGKSIAFQLRSLIEANRTPIRVEMASLQTFLMVIFFTAIACHQGLVDANFSKSMYINWGANHSSIMGEDLNLVLDQSSGKIHQPIIYHYCYSDLEALCFLLKNCMTTTKSNDHINYNNFSYSKLLCYLSLLGSGAQTKRPFLFGTIEMLIKLVPGNSAGTVTAYYVSVLMWATTKKLSMKL